MSLKCEHCDHINTADSLFCNHCGFQLTAEHKPKPLDLETITEECSRLHDQLKREIQEETQELKFEMLESFQEKATKWVKMQFWAATSAISIVVAIFAYAGFNSFKATEEYQQLVKESEDSIKQDLVLIKKSTESFDLSAQNSMKDLENSRALFLQKSTAAEKIIEEKMRGLKQFDTDKIRNYERKLNKTVLRIEQLQQRMTAQLARADQQFEQIKRLENNRFRILVHYRETEQVLYKKNLAKLESALYAKGFIIQKDDIANVSSDRQEILYYSEAKQIRNKINEIRQQLAEKFIDIPIRYESAGSFDPLRVIIKLCPQGNTSDSNCAIEP
jgi:hypothetical protein